MIRASDHDIFMNNMSTLKETSVDKRDPKNIPIKYMTESNIQVINFDGVKNDYIKKMGLKQTPNSVDALYIGINGRVVFIEFKSGSIKKWEIKGKIYHSVFIFSDIAKVGISEMRRNVDYVLVANEDKIPSVETDKNHHVQPSESHDALAKSIGKFGAIKYSPFGLSDTFEGYCFRHVDVLTKSEFENYISNGFSEGQRI